MALMQKLMTLVEVEEARAIMREDDDALMIAIAFAVRLDIMTFGVTFDFVLSFIVLIQLRLEHFDRFDFCIHILRYRAPDHGDFQRKTYDSLLPYHIVMTLSTRYLLFRLF